MFKIMENIAKYFFIIENLKFPNQESDLQCLQHNVKILKQFIKKDLMEIWESLYTTASENDTIKDVHSEFTLREEYILYIQHVLHIIIQNTNFNSDAKEDLISTRHINCCIETIQDLDVYGLREQLHPLLLKSGVFIKPGQFKMERLNHKLLITTIQSLRTLLEIKQFHISNSMELVVRDYISAIFTLYIANDLREYILTDSMQNMLAVHLCFIWQSITKLEYFRTILLLKAVSNLPVTTQKKLHMDLMTKLQSKDGFTTFVVTMHTAQKSDTHNLVNEKQSFEIISNIVANAGHSKRFQNIMIKQIFDFIRLCLYNEGMLDSMGAGLLALNRLYNLSEENKSRVKQIIQEILKNFYEPMDVLTGLIVIEHREFCILIDMVFQLFCTSVVECLPSSLLIEYLPMLINLYDIIPETFAKKRQLGCVIVRCLNDRDRNELEEIIEKLYTRKYDPLWRCLHKRLTVSTNIQESEINLKIVNIGEQPVFNISLALPYLLMSTQFHLLLYQTFMILLQLMSTIVEDSSTTSMDSADLLQSEDELLHFLNAKYPTKVDIIISLNTLISHQQLRTLITEHRADFFRTVRALIEKRIATWEENGKHKTEFTDQTLVILLSLLQEVLETHELPEMQRSLVPSLQKLKKITSNELILHKIKILITLINGDFEPSALQNSKAFNEARSLIESEESHLQVFGMQKLLVLIKQRDSVTLSNLHIILALGLSRLKNKESYTFLNCVRLFVGLVNVYENEVLEVLADEYLNENATMDYRLVVGEAILKVCQELGPLCYNYKNILINCYMHGTHSKLDEFRMSSFSNLAQLCRLLAYQVHNYFQELIDLINCELTTGQYIPSKRAAVLVLSELLLGMDNLIDFEEMLLPIYRLLKVIEANEDCDAKMRTHAANGLKALSEKCKKLLFPEEQLQKEIRILNINDDKPRGKKPHILELN